MQYRILQNEDGQYKVQRKGWIFWHDVGDYVLLHLPRTGARVVDSREEAEEIIAECQRELRQRKWREVGGKVLPPRPWPDPPEVTS
jgi:hypothetical protein